MLDLDNYYKQSIIYIKSINPTAIFYIFSNDIKYCQSIDWLVNENVKYILDLDEVDSLYLMSLCKNGGICCNSTYSWWGGYLNENINKLVIFPNKWFNSDWKVDIGFIGSTIMDINNYTIIKKKFDLTKTTFILAIRIEHNDRLINLKIILKYITYFFNTTIIIIENGKTSHYDIIKEIVPQEQLFYEFQYSNDELFHRMKILNECLSKVKTEVFVNYDIDCLLPIENYMKCQELILNNIADVIHPFTKQDGVFYIDIENKDKINIYNITDINNICRTNTAGNGFVIFFNTKKYISIGGENENFLSYGPEDNERIYRSTKLGLKYAWLKSKIYHLEHYRSQNSSTNNPYYLNNMELFEKIKKMNINELKTYYKIL